MVYLSKHSNWEVKQLTVNTSRLSPAAPNSGGFSGAIWAGEPRTYNRDKTGGDPTRVNALKSYVIKNSEKQGMKLRCKNHELVSSR